MLLGFDVKWDVLTLEDKKKEKPSAMQLSTPCCTHIGVIQIDLVFDDRSSEARRGVLAAVLLHDKRSS